MLANARKQTRRLARQLTERMPDSAQRGVREGWRRLRPYAKRVFYSRAVSPLVSIVIPVYAVERYLPDCLDSVLSQSYRHLQVILVDDGSPDRSIDIAREYAARDRRVKIVRQPNAGLGAARNTGARHARGTFLMFVDSDDVLRPDAVRSYVRTLRRTGSDFAVGAYERMTSAQTWPAAPWIRSAHRLSRLGTTLAESPDACVNAVAWSKCYRRRFWEQNGFAFPEGVLYEDQALSTRAYAKATRFDILSTVTYGWRVREDRSSITQQATALNDLRARLHAAENSLAELDRPGLEQVRNVRLAQYLSNDIPLSIRTAQRADDEFWELLTDGLRRLTAGAGPGAWDRVSAQHRVAIKLVIAGLRRQVVDFIGLEHNNPKNIPSRMINGRVHLDTPARHALGLELDDPLLALAEHQLGLISSIRRAYWDPAHRFHVEGWAHIENVDLSQCETDVVITAVEQRTGAEFDLAVEMRPSVEVTVVSKHRYADYEPSCFHATFDLITAMALLGRQPDADRPAGPGQVGADRPAEWQLRVTVTSGGIVRSGLLVAPDQGGSAGRLLADFLPDGRHAVVSYASGRTGLTVSVGRPPCLLSKVGTRGRNLLLSVGGTDAFVPHGVRLRDDRTQRVIHASSTTRADGTLEARCPLPAPGLRVRQPEPAEPQRWVVEAVARDGTRAPVAWPPEVAADAVGAGGGLRPERAATGQLEVVDEPVWVRVDDARIVDDVLRAAGRIVGAPAEGVRLRLQTPKAQTEAAVTGTAPTGDGPAEFTVSVPLQDNPWDLGVRPLPVGDYLLTATIPGHDRPVPVRMSEGLIRSLPMQFRTDRLLGQLRLAAPDQLAVRLEVPLADDERGARHQQRLQNALRSRVDEPGSEPAAVLLRSYYGEVCGCNPLALHEYLRSHPEVPGGPYTLYWAVTDYSVLVPEGGVAVLHDSSEWYRLLHDAQIYLDNMHQPLYHKKPRHQVQIQTFHGYPFKQMGLSHWAMQGRDVAHVQSYLDRAADWDYLVSPASYGTDALCREFGFPNTVLQIGYPRNDTLFSDRADKIAAEARDRLGIRPGQTAVLYGPTFRDSMSRNDFSAAMVDFLDLDRLADGLGDDYAVMVRGHAFNARSGERVGSRGTILDVTDYPNITDLILASDAAILDYSSLRFDYGLTAKPMIFMVPDLLQYQTEARGSLWAYEPTAPGPLLSSTDDVITALRDLARVRTDHAEAYAAFRRDFLDLDDGHATQRLVEAVFGKQTGDTPVGQNTGQRPESGS